MLCAHRFRSSDSSDSATGIVRRFIKEFENLAHNGGLLVACKVGNNQPHYAKEIVIDQDRNFGGNLRLSPAVRYTPDNEDQVLEILNAHRGQRIRCVGRRHSWSQVLTCSDVMLDLRKLDHIDYPEDGQQSVDVGAGCQIKQLLESLDSDKAWTLPSVGFIAEQSIAGAISTGTHGSGRPSLSHFVESVRLARYDPQSKQAVIDEVGGGTELEAARCSLGCLGIILSVRMSCRNSYLVEEHFREHRDLQSVLGAECEYPLQQFYLLPWRWTFFAQHRKEVPGPKSRSEPLYSWYRYLIFDVLMHLVILFLTRCQPTNWLVKSAFQVFVPWGVVREWRVVGKSSQQLVMKNELFQHAEMELFIPRSRLPDSLMFLKHALAAASTTTDTLNGNFLRQLCSTQALERMESLRGLYCHHYPICIRRVEADETLVSMSSAVDDSVPREDWYSISLINLQGIQQRGMFYKVMSLLAESMVRLFDARLHWGKLCPLSASQMRTMYPRFDEFTLVCRSRDPDGAFRNEWTAELLAADDH